VVPQVECGCLCLNNCLVLVLTLCLSLVKKKKQRCDILTILQRHFQLQQIQILHKLHYFNLLLMASLQNSRSQNITIFKEVICRTLYTFIFYKIPYDARIN